MCLDYIPDQFFPLHPQLVDLVDVELTDRETQLFLCLPVDL